MKEPVLCLPYDGRPLSAIYPPALAGGTLILCGQEPPDVTTWAYASDMAPWRIIGTRQGDDSGPAVYLEGPNKARVTVRWSATWDEEGIEAEELHQALQVAHQALVSHFPARELNFSSPVALGRHLMACCWKKDDIKVPPAPPHILQLLKESAPQGRHEILTLPDLETIPALYEYDMVLAYLWCCKGLPYGAVDRSTDRPSSTAKEGAWADKMRVVWSAPEVWQHIGLLPARVDGKWSYPRGGTGWVDIREWSLAQQKGWEMYVGEALWWREHGALDRWSDGMQAVLRQYKPGSLSYRILRRVALQAIGSLHRTTIKRSRTLPRWREGHLPKSCPSLRLSDDGQWYHWDEEQPILGREAIYMHPEWTTTIWARCRARIAQAAISVPRRDLIAIRQDAFYTATDQFKTDCSGRVGSIRLKQSIPGPLKAPHTLEELAVLMRRAE